MSKVDLHMHSTASDGTDTPEELLKNIRKSGITVFAITDHDTIEGAMQMEKLAPNDVKFIRGVEFSCKTPSGKCHIVGLNYDSQIKILLKPSKRDAISENRNWKRGFPSSRMRLRFPSRKMN